jgi:hypothetical protein
MIPLRFITAIAILALITTGAAALGAGDPLPRLVLADQQERPHRLGPDTRAVVFSADRPGSKVAEAALAGWNGARMQRSGLYYVADISGMPRMITRMLALPAMRDLPYPVLLAQDPAETAALPRRTNHATLLRVQHGRIEAVDHFDDSAALSAALEALAAR